MEEVYANVELVKPVCHISETNQRGSSSSERRAHLGVIISLGLLNVLLLAGLITIGVYYHGLAADLSTIKDSLTSVTEKRDLLTSKLTEVTEELMRLQSLSKQGKTCPAGWRMFGCSCYLLSTKNASWDEGREDCRNREADLMVVDNTNEQTFLSNFTKNAAWIGLNDKEKEGSWKWVDGTSLNLTFWAEDQPDNNGGDQFREEDCAHVREGTMLWNDLSCRNSLEWICEKAPT